jgi:hypothetical protein
VDEQTNKQNLGQNQAQNRASTKPDDQGQAQPNDQQQGNPPPRLGSSIPKDELANDGVLVDDTAESPEPLSAAKPVTAAEPIVDETPQAAVISMGEAEPLVSSDSQGQSGQFNQASQSGTSDQSASHQGNQPELPKPVRIELEDKPIGPKFFGYKPPKWVHDFDYVRRNKGKGTVNDTETWLLYTVDRLLKMHSV